MKRHYQAIFLPNLKSYQQKGRFQLPRQSIELYATNRKSKNKLSSQHPRGINGVNPFPKLAITKKTQKKNKKSELQIEVANSSNHRLTTSSQEIGVINEPNELSS